MISGTLPGEVALVRRLVEPRELGDRDSELVRAALGDVEEDLDALRAWRPEGIANTPNAVAAMSASTSRRGECRRMLALVDPGVEPSDFQVLPREVPQRREGSTLTARSADWS